MPSHSSGKTAAASVSDSHGIKSLACKTEILVRLWTRDSEDKKLQTDEAVANQPGAIAFIEDVVASRNGVLIPAEKDLYISILESPSEALVVSRQIQLGMQAFRNKPVSVSISISTDLRSSGTDDKHSESTSDSVPIKATPNHDLVTLVRMSRPAQVLLTHDLFKQISSFKGLPLKPFQGRFGVFEYLWTSEEKLLDLQSQQTLFAELVEESTPQSNPSSLPGSPIDYETKAGTRFTRETWAKQSSSWRPSFQSPWTTVALITLFLALAVVGGITYRMKRPASATQAKTTNVTGTSNKSGQPDPPHSNPPETPRNTPKTTREPPVPHISTKEEPVPANKPKKQAHAADEGDSDAASAEQKRACKVSQVDIKSFLQFAEQDRENGRYAEAKRKFLEVYDCDPRNEEALDGLRRIAAVHN